MKVKWENVTRNEVVRAMQEYDRLGLERFFAKHGFGPTTTYDLVWEQRRYPPKRSWAPLMNSPQANAYPPRISKAAGAARSASSKT